MADPALDLLRAALQILRANPERASLASAVEFALAIGDPGGADFGALVRQRREAAGWSIPDLAQRSKLSENTIRNIEGGRTFPAPDSLSRLFSVPELQIGVIEHAPPGLAGQKPNAHLPPRYDPTGMSQDLRAVVNGPGGTLEQSFLYLDPQSAAEYLAVCEAYGAVRGHQFAELGKVAERIAADNPPLDVIGIGSGDGRAEVCLTQALASRGRCGRLYLLDISHSLLTRANEHAVQVLHREGVEVEAVHGNFHELQRYPVLHAGPGKPRRLYTLLGATIANLADELRFFRDLHSCAAPGDLALVDFQVAHDPPERDPTLMAGAIPKVFFDWHAGPLRRNNAEVRNVAMHAQLHPGRMAGSYAIHSVATVTMADGSTRTYRVMTSARYRASDLAEALAVTGWRAVHVAPYDSRSASLLLQRWR